MTRHRTCVFTSQFSASECSARRRRRSVAGGPRSGLQLRQCLALIDAARGLRQEVRHVVGERAPDLDAELARVVRHRTTSALPSIGARAHADGKRRRVAGPAGSRRSSSVCAAGRCTSSAIWRWLTSTSEWGRAQSASLKVGGEAGLRQRRRSAATHPDPATERPARPSPPRGRRCAGMLQAQGGLRGGRAPACAAAQAHQRQAGGQARSHGDSLIERRRLRAALEDQPLRRLPCGS